MTSATAGEKLPRRISVKELLSSRYVNGCRPHSWDLRCEGVDVVRTGEGDTLRLASDGMQSPPQPGWELMLVSGDRQAGYCWTLYGIARE